jgi:hypothetical protein
MDINSTTHGEYSTPYSTELGKCDLSEEQEVAAGTTVLDDFNPTLPAAARRPFSYSKSHCWQYDIRLNNREPDLIDAGLTADEAATIKVQDLTFRFVDKSETAMCKRIVEFIRRHEWLGTMPLHPTHRFCQGRSESSPVRRSKSEPVELAVERGFAGEQGLWSVAEEALLPSSACGDRGAG